MMKRLYIAFLVLCVAFPALANSYAGRNYALYDGRNTATPAALVLVLHGAGGSGRQIRNSTSMDALARAHGFIVAYPSAPEKLWNDGRFSSKHKPHINKRNDVAWITGLVRDLAKQGLVDLARVYAIGHSNGGGMVRRLHCDNPALLSGIAIVSTKVLKGVECAFAKPVTTALFYGTKDKIAPHAGRNKNNAVFRKAGDTYSADQSVAVWRGHNKCRKSAHISRYNPDKTDQTRIVEYRYKTCAAPLVYYEMVGGGHAYPGAKGIKRPIARKMVGPPIKDIDAGFEAIKLWGLPSR